MQKKDTYTAAELATALNVSARTINLRATGENWPFIARIGRGGRVSAYLFAGLPADVQTALTPLDTESDTPEAEAARRLSALSAVTALTTTMGAENARELIAERTGVTAVTLYNWQRSIEGKGTEAERLTALIPQAAVPATLPPEPLDTSRLKDWQRKVMTARAAILAAIERRALEIGVNQAVKEAVSGKLGPETAALIPVANARSGGKDGGRTLSRNTIFRWRGEAAKGIVNLAPKDTEKAELPAWAGLFLEIYRKPQKPSIPQALQQYKEQAPKGFPVPSEGQIRTLLKKFSSLDIQRGRNTGSALRQYSGFIRRDTSKLRPLDVVTCDGHTFKAKVAHPVTGKPFQPEVCAVLDVKTRCVIGYSYGIAESAQTVGDAVRHSLTVNDQKPLGGVPCILYTDNGGGNVAARISDPVLGIVSRFNIEHKTGIPGNAQGRGMVEELNKILWIPLAKRLPTCVTKDMDKLEARKTYLLTNKDVKNTGRSDLLISWAEFGTIIPPAIDAYNRRPHAALPKITDPVTGLRRNMCPYEAWALELADGWKPVIPPQAALNDLFRPRIQRLCRRCEVTDLAGNRFYSSALKDYDGRKVFVEYDVHDPSRVWVRDDRSRLICVALFEANKRDYFPISDIEYRREERAKGQLKLLNQRAADIEVEMRGAVDVTPQTITKDEDETARKLLESPVYEDAPEIAGTQISDSEDADKPVYFSDDFEKYEFLLSAAKKGEGLSATDAAWLSNYEDSLFGEAM